MYRAHFTPPLEPVMEEPRSSADGGHSTSTFSRDEATTHRRPHPPGSPDSRLPHTPEASPEKYMKAPTGFNSRPRTYSVTFAQDSSARSSERNQNNPNRRVFPQHTEKQSSVWTTSIPSEPSQSDVFSLPHSHSPTQNHIYQAFHTVKPQETPSGQAFKNRIILAFSLIASILSGIALVGFLLGDATDTRMINRGPTVKAVYEHFGNGNHNPDWNNHTALLNDIHFLPDPTITPPVDITISKVANPRVLVIPVESKVPIGEVESVLKKLGKLTPVDIYLVTAESEEQSLSALIAKVQLSTTITVLTLEKKVPLLFGALSLTAVLPDIESQSIIIACGMSELIRDKGQVTATIALAKGWLSGRSLHSLPLGFIGAEIHPSELKAIDPPQTKSSADTAHPAAFILPPFRIGGDLLQTATMGLPPTDDGIWSHLGLHIARRSLGVGGAVLRGKSFRGVTTSRSDANARLMAAWKPFVSTHTTVEMPFLDHFTVYRSHGQRISSLRVELSQSPSTNTDSVVGNVLILAADAGHLANMSELGCRLVRTGHSVTMALIKEGRAEDEIKALASDSCHLHYSTHVLSTLTHNLIAHSALPKVLILPQTSHETTDALEMRQSRLLGGALESIAAAMSDHPITLDLPLTTLREAAGIGALDLLALEAWHTPRIELVLQHRGSTRDLTDAIDSLAGQNIYDDMLDLTIVFLEKPSRAVEVMLSELHWTAGSINVRILGRTMTQPHELLYPINDDHYMILLRDDMAFAPWLYAWTKIAILDTRYGYRASKHASLIGIALDSIEPIHLPLQRQPKQYPYVVAGELQEVGVHYPAAWKNLRMLPTSGGSSTTWKAMMHNMIRGGPHHLVPSIPGGSGLVEHKVVKGRRGSTLTPKALSTGHWMDEALPMPVEMLIY